ncbi:hypothetical protein K9K77_00050 [Candidatus Babeliales bacterium]|nr:hypothetical protein [Candidatus Babeliales bacterium]
MEKQKYLFLRTLYKVVFFCIFFNIVAEQKKCFYNIIKIRHLFEQEVHYLKSCCDSFFYFSIKNQELKKIIALYQDFIQSDDPLKNFLEADFPSCSLYCKATMNQRIIDTDSNAFYSVACKYYEDLNIDNKEIQFLFDTWKKAMEGKVLTVTFSHLLTQGLVKPVSFFNEYLIYCADYLKALELEIAFSDDYEIFYHGQKSFFGFYEDLLMDILNASFLKGLLSVSLPQEFLFIRIPDHLKEIMNNTFDSGEESVKRQKILDNPQIHTTLSVNSSFFGSSHRDKSCTWMFLAQNRSRYHINTNLTDCFVHTFFLPDFYKEKINHVRTVHEHFFTRGRLLQIVVPKSIVTESVIVTIPGAKRTSVYIPELYYHTSHVPEILKYRKKCLFEAYGGLHEHHFCMPLTEDILLNPKSGIKIIKYDATPLPSICFWNNNTFYNYTYQQYKNEYYELVDELVSLFITRSYIFK